MTGLSDVAARYAQVAVDNIGTEFPHATHHVVRGPDEPSRPRELHPAFHGAYDWHSCVHMHWLLVRLLSDVPECLDVSVVRDTLDATLTVDAIEAEAAHLRANPGFERPYGWAWAVALAAACSRCPDPAAQAWAAALGPLTDAVEELALTWLDRAVPRSGTASTRTPPSAWRCCTRTAAHWAATGWPPRSPSGRWSGSAPTATTRRPGSP